MSEDEDGDESSGGDERGSPSSSGRRVARRPPSYASEDGVSYIIEARPRSTLVPLGPEMVQASVAALPPSPLPVHPSEVGRIARPPSR